MMNFNALLVLAVSAASVFLVSCSQDLPPGSALAAYQAYDRPASLPADPGAVRVRVSLSKQRTYVMEGDRMLLAMPVSVGTSSTPTPRGNFTIFRKQARQRDKSQGYAYHGDQVKQCLIDNRPPGWSFKRAPLPYWCEFKSGYGFHTGWVKHHPCTLGSIRMHENLAPKFFRLVKEGTPVEISYSQPEDTSYRMPLPPDAGPLPDYPESMYLGDGYFSRHKTPIYNQALSE